MSIPNSQFISPPPLISWQPQVYFLYLKLYFCFIDKFICTLLKKEIPHISSVTQSCPTLCDTMDCSTPCPPSITNSQSLLEHMCIELVVPSNHLILCCPLLLLASVFPSIRVFSNESVFRIRWSSIGASASVLPMNIQD